MKQRFLTVTVRLDSGIRRKDREYLEQRILGLAQLDGVVDVEFERECVDKDGNIKTW